MFLKRCSSFLLVFSFIVCFFALSSSAARTGEFETYRVEFDALVPDDLTAPIEIVLTHKTESHSLKYYLYRENEYFSNEPVHPGEYDVVVNVGNFPSENFGFIYDKTLTVEPSPVAKKFLILINYANTEGDTQETVSETSSNNIASLEGDSSKDYFDLVSNVSTDFSNGPTVSEPTNKQMIVYSALIFLAVLAVAGVVLWLWMVAKKG